MIEFLEIFFFGQGNVQMAGPLLAGALISGGINILGGIFGGGAAKKRERAAQREKARKLNRKLNYLENNRQPITDPYAGVTKLGWI